MRALFAAMLIMAPLFDVVAQPADCPTEASEGPMLPLSLDLPGKNGQVYVAVPMTPPGAACSDAHPPPSDVLHGEPGDVLRGPGMPRVEVEMR